MGLALLDQHLGSKRAVRCCCATCVTFSGGHESRLHVNGAFPRPLPLAHSSRLQQSQVLTYTRSQLSLHLSSTSKLPSVTLNQSLCVFIQQTANMAPTSRLVAAKTTKNPGQVSSWLIHLLQAIAHLLVGIKANFSSWSSHLVHVIANFLSGIWKTLSHFPRSVWDIVVYGLSKAGGYVMDILSEVGAVYLSFLLLLKWTYIILLAVVFLIMTLDALARLASWFMRGLEGVSPGTACLLGPGWQSTNNGYQTFSPRTRRHPSHPAATRPYDGHQNPSSQNRSS